MTHSRYGGNIDTVAVSKQAWWWAPSLLVMATPPAGATLLAARQPTVKHALTAHGQNHVTVVTPSLLHGCMLPQLDKPVLSMTA
jgi:hypothetical protein